MSRILHISDLHFWHIPRNPLTWVSKRATTYLSLLSHPHRRFKKARMKQLLKIIDSLNLSHVIISGDLTVSGTDDELELFDGFFKELKARVAFVSLVPGNHDVYIERDRSRGFYRHAERWMPKEVVDELFEKRQAIQVLGDVEIILLDLTRPRPVFRAEGIFSDTQEQLLQQALQANPKADFRIVVGHYPMHPTKSTTQQLVGYEKLENSLRGNKSVQAYLHGHTHQQHVIDERFFGLPVSVDSGSLSAPLQAGFSLLELGESSNRLQMYRFDSLHGWEVHQELLWRNESSEIANQELIL